MLNDFREKSVKLASHEVSNYPLALLKCFY